MTNLSMTRMKSESIKRSEPNPIRAIGELGKRMIRATPNMPCRMIEAKYIAIGHFIFPSFKILGNF